MTRRIYFIVFLVPAVITMLHASVAARSFYSTKGIGLVRHFVSGRSMGMGGAGLAVTDAVTVNYLNPATLVTLPVTVLSGNLFHEVVELDGVSPQASISDTNVGGFQLAIPVDRQRATVAFGLIPYSTIDYAFRDPGTVDDRTFTEFVSGRGGVSTGFVSVAVRPVSRFSLGVSALLYFGRLRSLWELNYDAAEFEDTRDEISQSFAAGGVRAGFLFEVTDKWSLGGVFASAVDLNTEKELSTRFAEFPELQEGELDIPLAFGLGTSLRLGEKFVLAADFFTQRWSEANLQSEGLVNDSKRFAVGLEFSPSNSAEASYFERVEYRAGLFYRDLGIEQPVGQSVTEFFGTVGLGVPIKARAARIDLALEIGKRGSVPDNPIEESVIRFRTTVTAGELWFVRGDN